VNYKLQILTMSVRERVSHAFHVIITERARNAEETNATTKPLIPQFNKSDTSHHQQPLSGRRTITLPEARVSQKIPAASQERLR
jgi:hypothetical protein